MKQTAVEWLFEQISTSKYFYNLMEDINSRSTVAQSNIFEQAKEMDKEQIIESFSHGVINHHDAFKNENKFGNGEQSDNENFKSE